jgi:hypothetical protein
MNCPNDEEAVAYHEAAHAVVSLVLGYRCRYVAIRPKGEACCDQPAEHALQILIAARIAEAKHAGSSDIWRDSDDKVRATNLALWITRGDTEQAGALISLLIAETTDRVEEHWPAIGRVAAALLERSRIPGDELAGLI